MSPGRRRASYQATHRSSRRRSSWERSSHPHRCRWTASSPRATTPSAACSTGMTTARWRSPQRRRGSRFHVSRPSADYWQQWVSGLGAFVCGRTLFDVTDGWGGRHTMDVPVVVVTHQVPTAWIEAHPDAPFHFVTDGVEAAVAKAQELAGDRIVAAAAGTIARQCLELGLLDEVADRPGARRDGQWPPVLRRALGRRCTARRPDGRCPGRSRAAPAVSGEARGMRRVRS